MSRRSFPRIDPSALRAHADEAQVDRVWERIEHDIASHPDRFGMISREASRGRRSTLAYVAIAAAFGAFSAGLFVGKATWGRRAVALDAPVATPAIDKSRVEVLAAGSQIRSFPLEGGGRLTLSPGATAEVERAGTSLTVSLLQGEASIDATGRRGLAVIAGEARINTQAGSVLSVRRNADDMDVSVSDGSASVTLPDGRTQQLVKNERAEALPLHAAVASRQNDAAPRHNPAAPARRTHGKHAAAKGAGQPEWLVLYPTDEDGALVLLRKQGVDQAINQAHNATELMAIADIMRHKGRDQAAAVRAFRRVVEAFPGDQNAFSAANYLADLYQGQGQADLAKEYRDKAKFFATAADALYCNLIDAETDKTKAAGLAMEYLRRYPNGQCHARIREMVQQDDAPAVDPPAASAVPSVAPAAPPSPAPEGAAAPPKP